MSNKTAGNIPMDSISHLAIAESKKVLGDELGALAHLIAVKILDNGKNNVNTESIQMLCDVATGYFMKGDYEASEYWYRMVIALQPGAAIAYQNLAAIYLNKGLNAEADDYKQQAYLIQRVFVETTSNPARRLLVLCSGRTSGNIALETLLSSGTSVRIKYIIDYASPEEDALLPEFDLVFNAIGDPDVAELMSDRMAYFVNQCDRPLLNHPSRVVCTQRHRLSALMEGIEHVVTSTCTRFEPPFLLGTSLSQSLSSCEINFPVLLRPSESHGGQGLERYESLAQLEAALKHMTQAYYLTTFHDYRSPDGYYRKYRVIFINREPFPYHLAISSHWMVHYFSADMENSHSKVDEEHRFLQDPLAAIGKQAMSALFAIGRQINLD